MNGSHSSHVTVLSGKGDKLIIGVPVSVIETVPSCAVSCARRVMLVGRWLIGGFVELTSPTED